MGDCPPSLAVPGLGLNHGKRTGFHKRRDEGVSFITFLLTGAGVLYIWDTGQSLVPIM